jgi:hypothetical protein
LILGVCLCPVQNWLQQAAGRAIRAICAYLDWF